MTVLDILEKYENKQIDLDLIKSFWEDMSNNKCSYHPEDDPHDVVFDDGISYNSVRLFTDVEADRVKKLVDAMWDYSNKNNIDMCEIVLDIE